MNENNNELGFVAFWKATDAWFNVDKKVKEEFMLKLKEVMEEAKSKGIKTFGNFDCSWSSQWRYFTFWTCPNIELLEETMKKLVDIGDINLFNEQHHYVGRLTENDFVQ